MYENSPCGVILMGHAVSFRFLSITNYIKHLPFIEENYIAIIIDIELSPSPDVMHIAFAFMSISVLDLVFTVITSSSRRDYTVSMPDGSARTHSYVWTQSIEFQSCPHEEVLSAAPASQQLSVDQIFVMYDSSNQLIRFATSNKIGSIHSKKQRSAKTHDRAIKHRVCYTCVPGAHKQTYTARVYL